MLIRGRIGDGWVDVDQVMKVPEGTTLGGLVAIAEARRIPLREALDNSPHLAQTLMLNGERTPIAEHGERVLAEGDQIYLLAPLAGG